MSSLSTVIISSPARMYLLVTGIVLFMSGISLADVPSDLMKNQVVPDVINKAPVNEVEVEYGKKKVRVGEELTPTEVKNAPEIDYKDDDDALYTLIMTDPDAPSRQTPTNREFVHWLVGNIPEDEVSKGDVLAPYVGSGPPKGTGLHRYVFLVYKQKGKITFNEPQLTSNGKEGRRNFSAKKFAEKYNLGDPIAANMFQAQWDQSVSN
ncbi:protein D2-like [Leptopilina heterotoma]|uniref:protein D2-like n=1 Tax=Leptopilina heterotoma TaxID=63436 RepID=UPI001CA90FE0|nr:protein D2-like [Leptopilina heterotoma]